MIAEKVLPKRNRKYLRTDLGWKVFFQRFRKYRAPEKSSRESFFTVISLRGHFSPSRKYHK